MLSRQQVLSEAIRVVNQGFVGMFTTVDADGVPHSRLMGSASLEEGLHRLYTLSGKHARKIQQLQTNPNVCWVFTSAHFGDVVTLLGTARVVESPIVSQHVFDRLMDAARTYVMGALADESNLEFVAIETLVRKVEYYSPRQKLYQPQVVDLQNV